MKHKSYVSGFTLTLGGLMETSGDLVVPIETGAGKAEEFKKACPKCAVEGVATGVKQFYECKNDLSHTAFSQGELVIAKEIAKDTLKLVDAEAVAAAKKSELPAKAMEVDVYQRDEVARSTFPMHGNGTHYVFRPTGVGKLYPVLAHMLRTRPDLTFIGQANIGGADKLMQVQLGLNDQLVLVQLAWPGDLREFETPDTADLEGKLLTMAETFVEASIESFAATTYTKGARKRLAELVEQSDGAVSVPAETPTVEDDFEARLVAALGARKKKVA